MDYLLPCLRILIPYLQAGRITSVPAIPMKGPGVSQLYIHVHIYGAHNITWSTNCHSVCIPGITRTIHWELISQLSNGPLHIYIHNGWDQHHNATARIRYSNSVVLYIYIPHVGPFIISTTSTGKSTVSFRPPLGQKQI